MTIEQRHKRAKDSLYTVIKTLFFQGIIADGTKCGMIQSLEEIEDSPYSLMADLIGRKIELDVNGDKFIVEVVISADKP